MLLPNVSERREPSTEAVVPTPRQETVDEPPSTGKWLTQEGVNPLDDSRRVTLALDSDEGRSSMLRKPIRLFLRCQSNKTELYINWEDYLGSEASVTTRVGSGTAETGKWNLSTDSQATFYPDSHITFIKQLLETDRFVAQVTPYNESPVTAVFDLTGITEVIKPLRETCGW